MSGVINKKTIWPSICNALPLFFITGSLAVGIAFSIAGILTGGTFRANFALALFVISVLLNLATLFSYSSTSRIERLVKVSWSATAIICLVFTEYILKSGEIKADTAADTVLIFAMFILTFPAGCIALGAIYLYSGLLLSSRGANSLELALFWLFFFVAGYLQWFRFFPWLRNKWRAYRRLNI